MDHASSLLASLLSDGSVKKSENTIVNRFQTRFPSCLLVLQLVESTKLHQRYIHQQTLRPSLISWYYQTTRTSLLLDHEDLLHFSFNHSLQSNYRPATLSCMVDQQIFSSSFTHLSTILQSQQQWLTFRLIYTTMLAAPWKVGSHKQNVLTCSKLCYRLYYRYRLWWPRLSRPIGDIPHCSKLALAHIRRFGVARSTWLSQQCHS